MRLFMCNGAVSSTVSSTLQNSAPVNEEKWQPSDQAQAVDIPAASSHDEIYNETEDIVPLASPFGLPVGAFTNPPRLPLPIERDPEPPSPILAPQDPGTGNDNDVDLPKRASLVCGARPTASRPRSPMSARPIRANSPK